jgi:hypothetical protein
MNRSLVFALAIIAGLFLMAPEFPGSPGTKPVKVYNIAEYHPAANAVAATGGAGCNNLTTGPLGSVPQTGTTCTAAGTGTNDTATFQRAWNDACAAGGGNILTPCGDYRIGGPGAGVFLKPAAVCDDVVWTGEGECSRLYIGTTANGKMFSTAAADGGCTSGCSGLKILNLNLIDDDTEQRGHEYIIVDDGTITSNTTGSITAYAEYGGTVPGCTAEGKPIACCTAANTGCTTLITDAAHGLSGGERILISGSTNYNDYCWTNYVNANSFYCEVMFEADDGASTWSMVPGIGDDVSWNAAAEDGTVVRYDETNGVLRIRPDDRLTDIIDVAGTDDVIHLFGSIKTVTGATQANPVVITSNNHGFSDGEVVRISGVVGMVEINDRSFTVANSAANTYELSGENGLGHAAYVSDGTAQRHGWTATNVGTSILSVATNEESHGFLIRDCDDCEVAHNRWEGFGDETLEVTNSLRPKVHHNLLVNVPWTAGSGSGIMIGKGVVGGSFDHNTCLGGAGGNATRCVTMEINSDVTTSDNKVVDNTIIDDGLLGSEIVISGASQADPVVIDAVAHGLTNGWRVFITGITGMEEINDRWFFVANKNDDDFELRNEDGTGHGAWSAGGVARRLGDRQDVIKLRGARYSIYQSAFSFDNIGMTIRDNKIWGGAMFFFNVNLSQLVIENNSMYGTGIVGEAGHPDSHALLLGGEVTARGNHIYDYPGGCVDVVQSGNLPVIIDGNHCLDSCWGDNCLAGMYFRAASASTLKVINNNLEMATNATTGARHGIVGLGIEDSYAENNTVIGPDSDGIKDIRVIKGNTIVDAIDCIETNLDYAFISDNECDGNTDDGIVLTGTNFATVKGNVCRNMTATDECIDEESGAMFTECEGNRSISEGCFTVSSATNIDVGDDVKAKAAGCSEADTHDGTIISVDGTTICWVPDDLSDDGDLSSGLHDLENNGGDAWQVDNVVMSGAQWNVAQVNDIDCLGGVGSTEVNNTYIPVP